MRLSWNWLSEWVDLTRFSGPAELADLLTSRGLEVEAIERLDQGLEKVVTAQILKRDPHPQADRLSLCLVTTGSGEPQEIVCGAQNMKAGDKVALAQVGAHLPNGVQIAQSKIRGVVSNGMLCSEEELKLKDTSEGILILPPETQLGLPLAEFLGRNDTILTLKLTANRGDCLSHAGIAREVASALGLKVKAPFSEASLPSGNCPIQVSLDAGEKAPQFFGCWMEGVRVGPSPEWLVRRLESLGQRSINSVVDVTNYVLLELGHPTHAYDGDRIEGKEIHVRMAHAGEQLPLLDGKTAELTGSEIVIADRNRAIGLAGVMGGGNSEVQLETRNLFLECAEFQPTPIRQAATRHQRRTEASHRFERGVDPAQLPRVLARLAQLMTEVSGGRVVGTTQVQTPSREVSSGVRSEIVFGLFEIHDFLGFPRDHRELTLQRVEEILKAHDCQVMRTADQWKVTPPTYRLDLNLKQDLAEEVARSVGYNAIPSTIPTLSSSPRFGASSLGALTLVDQAKDALVRLGLQETINFAFTSRQRLAQLGCEGSVRVLNPLSEEYEWMVPSLLPGLIENASENWRHHFGSEPLAVRLFELRPVFTAPEGIRSQGQMDTGVQERWKLSLVLSGPRFAGGLRKERGEVDFYDLKAVIEGVLAQLGTKGVRFQPMSASRTGGNPLYHPGQSVEVLAGNTVAGYFGLLHPAKARELKTRAPLWMAELDWQALAKLSRGAFVPPTYQAWPEFPGMERDFALVVKKGVSAEKICQVALKSGKPIAKFAKIFDIYEGSQVAEGMTSVAVRVIFYDESRSLQESETEAASARIVHAWKQEFDAELRG